MYLGALLHHSVIPPPSCLSLFHTRHLPSTPTCNQCQYYKLDSGSLNPKCVFLALMKIRHMDLTQAGQALRWKCTNTRFAWQQWCVWNTNGKDKGFDIHSPTYNAPFRGITFLKQQIAALQQVWKTLRSLLPRPQFHTTSHLSYSRARICKIQISPLYQFTSLQSYFIFPPKAP